MFNRAILNKIIILFILWFGSINLVKSQGDSGENERINSLLDRIEKENRIVEELTNDNLTNLPVGIKKTISNNTIIIGIDSARITPGGMIINAYSRLILPGCTRYITFALRNAIITPSGLSTSSPTRLEMTSNLRIPLNNKVTLVLPNDASNFIEWDCSGFRSVSLSGVFEFSPEIFIPDDQKNQQKVTAQFIVNTSNLNNILVSTSITPFRIKGLGDMAFSVLDAAIDMSDFENCQGFAMPDDYKTVFQDAPQLWRGFFLKEVSIRLPSELNSSEKPVQITASDFLIDEFGISGRFSATNLLSPEEGNASGWPFSIRYLELSLVQNKIKAGEMSGIIGVPFLGDEPLNYEAQVINGKENLDYAFTIKGSPDKEFPIPFGGKVKLDKGCIFSMKTVEGKFVPSAVLNGSLNISADPAEIEGLRFEKLYLIAESPYIKGGVFEASTGISCSLAGFGLSIDSVTLAIRGGKASLALNTRVSLMNKNEKGVSASTRFFLNASVKKEPGIEKVKWNYDGIVLEQLKVKGNASMFYLSGNVALLNDHPVYGDAFIGKVGFTAGKLIQDTAKAEVTFGKRDDFKYWLARLNIPTKIPIGAVTLNHLGGGAYSNMVRANLEDVNSDYIPDRNAGLGLIAETGLYIKTEKIFNANVLLEIAVNKTGGVRYVRFSGDGRFFTAPDKGENNFMKTTALLNMVYDNTNDCFHANLSVFMNVADALRGTGPDDLLGEAVIHSDPQDWYVYIGRPSNPLGVKIAGLLRAQTYFMAGTRIEQMPLPPSEVTSILSNFNSDFLQNERNIATGRGVAFGLMFKATAGIGSEKGFVYAYFNAGAGADIMLQDFGEAKCEGRSGPIGINGWYASGQGYAYLTGRIGIRVKSAEFDIMSVAAALLIQAKMPNPSWFRGSISAKYSVLGGLVRGKVNVTVVLGEECIAVATGNPISGLNLIGDISPADRSIDVDVFSAPQVSFNTVIDKEFGMVNLNDEYAVYRVRLDEFNLLSDNRSVGGRIEWNPSHDMATFALSDVLPGKKDISATVKVHIEKRTPSGWQQVEGSAETKNVAFTTGEEPKTINPANISYSYPLKNQYNFHKSEYPEGYIKLKMGQRLFDPVSDGVIWSYVVKITSGNKIYESPFRYNATDAVIKFAIPQELADGTVYNVQMIKRPVRSQAIDANLKRSDLLVSAGNPNDSTTVATTDITNTDVSAVETELYSYSFRTSLYPTFAEKMQSIQNWKDQYSVDDFRSIKTYMSILYIDGSLDELFDEYEIGGSASDPLISIEAMTAGVPWFSNHAYPLIYELHGTAGLYLDRDISKLGLVPVRAVYLANLNHDNFLLTATNSEPVNGHFYFKYDLPAHVSRDFYELRDKAAARYLGAGSIPEQALRLLAGRLKDIPNGNYPFRLSYRLPGNTLTFSKEYVFKY